MKTAFYIINYTYFICVGILLLFASMFYLGGKEQLQLQLINRWVFIFGRIVFNEAILFIFLLFLFIANFYFRKSVDFKTRFRLVLRAFAGLSIVSVLFVIALYAFR
ncbi:hypothetical protein OGH69_06090 [Flavobacterium sp. MFBS3-15]|uniref:hypothetical protein n=1 Tax=Flavobacterium sp. MFBS3-15 TaxID=2989816 RepID=UPI00223643FB|nr:hypothetical protein [Flavobacterium sp. MFBS3-15]MCW4468525.1 hypothetical protein [Flavobacterium sp. MFBS3-15]